MKVDDINLNDEFLIQNDLSIDDDFNEEIDEMEDYDDNFKLKANKHKISGTHTLERDILLKGRDNQIEDIDGDYLLDNEADLDLSSKMNQYKVEENYDYEKQIKKDVYMVLKTYTTYDFNKNRRIPPKPVFNEYYGILLDKLKHKYSKCDLVVEYSGYFTEELSNTVKYLNKDYMCDIIAELKNKGKLKFLNDNDGVKFIK